MVKMAFRPRLLNVEEALEAIFDGNDDDFRSDDDSDVESDYIIDMDLVYKMYMTHYRVMTVTIATVKAKVKMNLNQTVPPPVVLVLVILILTLIMWLGLEEGVELGLGGEEPGAGDGEEVIPTQEGVASRTSLGHGWSTHSPCSLMLMPMITPGERSMI
jgi:hypothetical protein